MAVSALSGMRQLLRTWFRRLEMQLQRVAVYHHMMWTDLLAVENLISPDSRKLQALGNITVNQPGDIMHRITAADREGFVFIRGLAR